MSPSKSKEYEVRVHETHEVVYVVRAKSAKDAEENYGDGDSCFVACLDSTVKSVKEAL